MAWVDPTTRATGYTVTAAEWNQNTVENPQVLRDLLEGGTAGQLLTAVGGGTISGWAAPAGYTEQSTSGTGAQNDFSLSARRTYLRCTGTAPEFSGFTVGGSTPSAGDIVIVDCLGTTTRVLHQSSSSTAANRVICPSTNGQIIGASGRMLLVYDATTSRWRETLIDPGTPISVPFDAADYTASGSMTWTVASGDVIVDTYVQRGQWLTLNFMGVTMTVGGYDSDFELRKAVPGGFALVPEAVTVYSTVGLGVGSPFNGLTMCVPCVKPGVTSYVSILYFFSGQIYTWPVSTNETEVYFNHSFRVS